MRIKSWLIPLIILFWIMVIPCGAIEPAWKFTFSEREIGNIAVAPDGSTITAGTGKVLLLSKNGTVLSNEPFGDIIAQSRDGSTIVSAYSSVVSSTVYVFKKKTDANGNPILQKQWEATQPDRISSFAISDKGDRIAFSLGGKGITVYDGNTGKRLGHSDKYSDLIAMSGRGATISGISIAQGLRVYNLIGYAIKKYDITLAGKPTSFLMTSQGDIVVFNAGPQIIAFNLSEGSESWRVRSSGDVNMLDMTPSGSAITAGTENGIIELYSATGNLTWAYSNSGKAIKAVALTRDGLKIIAGSIDGKIVLLDSAGNVSWLYDTKGDSVTKVAIAADGSLATAVGQNSIYAFSTAGQGTRTRETGTKKTTTAATLIPGNTSAPSSTTASTPIFTISTPGKTALQTPTVAETEYSVVRKATQSPLEEMTGIAALLVVLLIFVTRKDT